MSSRPSKVLLLLIIVALIAAFFLFDLHHYLTLEYLKDRQQAFADYYAAHRLLTIVIYFILYVLVTALSLPGAAVMTLAGGALLGFWAALITVSFASSIGATLAFLASRFLFRDGVQNRFGDKLRAINAGIEREGAFYLFTLRLVPLFPFFVINLVMGLTPMRTLVYYAVSQIGMLPGTAVYVNAGTQLGQIERAAGILSPGIILSFVLLGLFPLIAKRIVDFTKRRKAYAGWRKPNRFDYNVVVIGAGSGGLVSAYIAAAVKAKVALIEKDKMGGDCLNTGCVPSKALLRSAKILSYARRAEEFGLGEGHFDYRFADVMERVQKVIEKVAPHDSVARYTELGVDCFQGAATITSPWTVTVNDTTLTTRSIVLATGARPAIPPIKGLDTVDYLTSDNLWQLRENPGRLVVLGGGPIGSEITQAMARLGAEVTQVEMGPHLLPREDQEVGDYLQRQFEGEGIRVLTAHTAREVRHRDGEQVLLCEHDGTTVAIPFDQILVAVGRQPNVTGYGLEELGVVISDRGTVSVDPFLRTNFPNIFAVGDVAGPYQFTHTASHMAWYATVNALFGDVKSFKVDYSVIPWTTFTDPEIARVGLSEEEAKASNISCEVTRYGIDDLDRAIADAEDRGWIKVLTKPGADKLLGVTIVGCHAGDLLQDSRHNPHLPDPGRSQQSRRRCLEEGPCSGETPAMGGTISSLAAALKRGKSCRRSTTPPWP
ncbi:MAG: FAD-dependent oxidoreductase [Desulfuromonadales bacterium]